MSKVLVTGAAGFIGSHTVDLLLAEGHQVLGVDNFRTGNIRNLACALTKPGFQFAQVDFTEALTMDRLIAVNQPDALIHLAAMVSVPESIAQPAENYRLNFLGTKLLAVAAKRHGVKRLVFASSAAVYGDGLTIPIHEDSACQPASPYGSAKLASELILLNQFADASFQIRVHRYFNVFGPRQDPHSTYSGVISKFAVALDSGTAVTIFGDGEQTRDFISVADIARANLLAATLPIVSSGIANICTGREVSLNELYKVMGRLWGNSQMPSYAPARAGDIRHSCGSSSRALEHLAFASKVTLEDGLLALKLSLAQPHESNVQ